MFYREPHPREDQLRYDRPRPQSEIQTVLARITTVHPPQYLLLLSRRQTARPSRRRRRAQRRISTFIGRIHPLVDGRPVESVRRNHARWRFAFADPFYSHQPNRFQRLMIECSSVSSHGTFDQPLPDKFLMCRLTLRWFSNDYLTGNVTTQVNSSIKMIGVRVWMPADMRKTVLELGQLQLRAPDGHLFPLKRVASFDTLTGQPEISRENLKQMVAVTARIEGRDLGSTVGDVKAVMNQAGLLPKGAYYELGGLYQQQQIAFHGLIMVFAAAIALVFFLLLFMYESFRLAISILTTSLLAVWAVFIGLWLTHIELNITAMMGMTMIIGIVTEVAIFYFSEQQELATSESWQASLIQAGVNRMRPIAMTTIAAILTLLPLAFAVGEGSQMQQPLAIAIISGLIVQLPLVLLVMPVLFNLLHRKGGTATRHLRSR